MLSTSAFVCVLIGGAFGAVARVSLIGHLALIAPGLPIGMIGVNLIGSFVIGFAYLPLSQIHLVWLKFALIGGFLGAFTTFSTYALDSFILFQQKRVLALAFMVFCLPLLCVVSVALGHWCAQRLGF